MSLLDTKPVTSDVDGQERDRQKHYVRKIDLERAMMDGVPARALCGKMWLPSRDPARYPICKTCQNIFGGLRK